MLSTPETTGGHANQIPQLSPKLYHSNQLNHTATGGRGDADFGARGDGEETKESGDQYHHPGVAVVKSVEGADNLEHESDQAEKEAEKENSASVANKIVQNKDAEDRDEVKAHIMRNILQSSNSRNASSVENNNNNPAFISKTLLLLMLIDSCSPRTAKTFSTQSSTFSSTIETRAKYSATPITKTRSKSYFSSFFQGPKARCAEISFERGV